MNDQTESRPYNSSVVDNYLNYLAVYYPDIRIGPILKESNINPWEPTDPGHWFSQRQINDFHKALSRRITDVSQTTLARSVGRFTASERSNKFLRLAFIHLLRPENLFSLAGKIVAKFIKSVDVDWKRIHDSKFEVILTFRKSIRPERFQCENFIGNSEAIIRLFANKWPRIEHPECYFRGHGHCRYIISWEKERFYYLNKFRSFMLLLTPVIFLILFISGSYTTAIAAAVGGAALIYHLTIHSNLLIKKNAIEAFKRNDFKILDLHDAMANFYNYTSAFGEAAKSLSGHVSIANVLEKFSQSLQGLGYDQGLICLYDDKTNHLHLRHIFGFDKEKRAAFEQLKEAPLSLSKKDLKTTQTHDSMEDIQDLLSHQIISGFSEITEPLVVPMIYERGLIGMIVAQNGRGHENLTASDISLVQAVASQTALVMTNIAAYETVTANEKLKNQFLTMASHELRTPIQAIFFAYDDLNEKLSGEKKAELNHSLMAIEKGVIRLKNITDNLLNLSKIEARETLAEEKVSIHELIHQVTISMEHIISSAEHEMVVENRMNFNEKLICDEGLLVQVMTNIIINAAKFTPRRGKIIIRAYRGQAEFCIDIIDNGCGIPPHDHQKIFMKFYQARSDGPTIENEGCGLGLSFCKEVVQKHGGYIILESPLEKEKYREFNLSENRKGSLFRIHLPLERVVPNDKKKVIPQ